MKLKELLDKIEAVGFSGGMKVEFGGVTYDSRKVKPGDLFVAVSGYQLDGSEFITQAVSGGATVVVSENRLDLGSGVAHVQVSDSRKALAEISAVFYGELSKKMKVIGVTGTNGKTTTTYMIRDILRHAGYKTGLLGTVAYEIGGRSIPASRTTPEAPDIHSMFAQMDEAGCEYVVMEVSSHALALKRVHGIEFSISVFTNLTQDHLDYHHDMETYFDVKAELFRTMEKKQGGSAVINIDDSWGRRLIGEKQVEADIVSYGFHEKATAFVTDATVSADGTRFNVSTPWGDTNIHLQLLGRFNIHNALAALCVGGLCGVDLKTVVQALENMAAVPGRLEAVPNRKNRSIFVDYAHTDDALNNVLTTLREICRGKLVVVFGCGGNRDQGKREKMGRVAAALADWSIVTSDNPRDEEPEAIAMDILKGFALCQQVEVVLDRREAIAKGIAMLDRKDVLVVAGKGHETYQEIKGAVIPFDDRDTVKELIR
ncbi:UDP-N-acetylmuramoyl-L-alanyl-D-glutamate--2,6-diaminopimelate ligase [Pontiella agarivorans]|uniref:UDP-N-acetylmuramoyl-L-alanyl-D-glutamate--2,6-diaminopimelate ligase n=1 Tax=Pontiella agarivorans TaxID=3038953 RepID=A0ABU5MSE0_9BACT|nr:UDP-N-acetylmuramoyl-L-alanyl-D-glutamate--2,6-diaminopimelate ligase [Pontiella agarivorans]MDZ8117119.1 UDP-N-acetylmuramoyl-L-alanyl-D-glutamate--2,6-diaminopimelate ligase [Pontiella agarivorans]